MNALPTLYSKIPPDREIPVWKARHRELQTFPPDSPMGRVAQIVGRWREDKPHHTILRMKKAIPMAASLIQKSKPFLTGPSRIHFSIKPIKEWTLLDMHWASEVIADNRAEGLLRLMYTYAIESEEVRKCFAAFPDGATIREEARICREWLKEHEEEITPFMNEGHLWFFYAPCLFHPSEITYYLNRDPENLHLHQHVLCHTVRVDNHETFDAIDKERVTFDTETDLRKAALAAFTGFQSGSEELAMKFCQMYPKVARKAFLDILGNGSFILKVNNRFFRELQKIVDDATLIEGFQVVEDSNFDCGHEAMREQLMSASRIQKAMQRISPKKPMVKALS